jgi:glycosyltransferase involved in cell wall biosynthesis
LASRISIALCTFDGARFLEPQLESFVAQSRLPDELVVCDDRSSDDTLVILEAFAGRAPFPVRIEVNPVRLGSTRNFEKAIGLCTGDLIATSDQDDVWLPEKLALCEAAFARDPTLGLVFTDAEIVDESLRPLGYTLWESIHFDRRARRRVTDGDAFGVLLRQWLVTGAATMFRADLRPVFLPIPDVWVHDGWIAFLAGAVAPVGMVDHPTVRYRQHPGQQIGGVRFTWRQLYRTAKSMGPAYFRRDHERFRLALDRLSAFPDRIRNEGSLERVNQKLAHQARRLAISESPSRARRILLSLDELLHGRYARYSPAWSHAVKDMFL